MSGKLSHQQVLEMEHFREVQLLFQTYQGVQKYASKSLLTISEE